MASLNYVAGIKNQNAGEKISKLIIITYFGIYRSYYDWTDVKCAIKINIISVWLLKLKYKQFKYLLLMILILNYLFNELSYYLFIENKNNL